MIHVRFIDFTVQSTATKDKKDDHRQRNVRPFLHILASPGYAPGTIAVSVTWMERGFNACQSFEA